MRIIWLQEGMERSVTQGAQSKDGRGEKAEEKGGKENETAGSGRVIRKGVD